MRTYHPFQAGDDRMADPLIRKALNGETVASTVVVSRKELQSEGSDLAERAFIFPIPTPKASERPGDEGNYGMMLEAPYIDLQNKVVYSFFGIGVLGVFLVLMLSFFITTGIIRPLREMVWATRKIAEGDLSLELSISSRDEIGQLAEFFNHMLIRLKQARQELEDYGRALEEKVEQRSQQLKKIQGQLMQSEKLASLAGPLNND